MKMPLHPPRILRQKQELVYRESWLAPGNLNYNLETLQQHTAKTMPRVTREDKRGCKDAGEGERFGKETGLISKDFKHGKKLKFWTEL